jgi:hypothetical protein
MTFARLRPDRNLVLHDGTILRYCGLWNCKNNKLALWLLFFMSKSASMPE